MAMQNVQKNLAARMQTLAIDLIAIKTSLAVTIAMYAAENMATLTDADYAELAEFAHVTVAEMTAAKNALSEANVTLGEFVPGSVVTRLMRIINVVPK
jgi:hypothetical protein